VANLYPFRETLLRDDLTAELARTHIDIGGPCMIRAAAKNFLRVAVVTDPGDYAALASELRNNQGTLGLETRFHLMRKAFAHTAAYDQAIARYFADADPEAVRALYRTVG
jgi:phosphoribosylaminoimidazolecarboxamide formyltransferase/IMP cyclohydrolase